MTNTDKFEEVFGFRITNEVCVAPAHFTCADRDDCKGCYWEDWQNKEYVELKGENK